MVQTLKIGNDVVAKVGHGLMRMTWTADPVSDDVAFESIKASIDAAPEGVKMFINGGEFYSLDLGTANLELVSRFFEKYPSYADRAFLSVKGGVIPGTLTPDSSPENLRRSVDASLAALRGKKSIDLFEPARIDPKLPIEAAMQTLKTLADEGKFRYIGLSECKAETLQRAHKVAPVAAVEIEVGPLSYEEETRKVLATSKGLGVAVVAYSPISQGLFTGKYTKPEDAPEDRRAHWERWADEEIFKHNLQLVEHFKTIAEKKGVTMPQLAIAWVGALGENIIPLPGSSHKTRTEENCAVMGIELTDDEVKELTSAVTDFKPLGARYAPETPFLWG